MVAETKKPEATTAIVKMGEARSLAKPQLMRPIATPAEVIEAIKETQALLKETLVEGVDFGVIPGTEKSGGRKVLLKPGAEKISIGFGCHPEYELLVGETDHEKVMRFKSAFVEAPKRASKEEEERMKKAGTGRFRKVDDAWQWQEKGDGFEETVGLYRFRYKCRLVRFDGVIVGEGEGVCSSLESKYRSRPHDVENTILKMAQKRARIAATLDAFGLSDAFTQDVIEEDGVIAGELAETPASKPAAAAVKAAINEAHEQVKANEDEAKKKAAAAALSWAKGFLDKLDKAAALPKDADDDVRKGALEAFSTVLDENEAPLKALATQAPKLHFAVTTYQAVLAGHLHGTEVPIEERDRAALDWLHTQRGPATTTT